MPKKSSAWNYFNKKGNNEAECLMCTKVLKSTGGSTTGLFVHLKSIHNITEIYSNIEYETIKKQKTSTSYVTPNPKSMEEEIARLAALDGVSFNSIASSKFIQENLAKNKYDKLPPITRQSVIKMVNNFYDEKKIELKNTFKTLISEGIRFCVTLDEYTSIKNVRYMNINVHHKDKYWSFGLIKILGDLDHIKVIEVIKKRLSDFGLDFDKHVIGCTTDGASVMVNFGKEISPVHQQCLAHAMHLAITSVLYKKQMERDPLDWEISRDSENLVEIIKKEQMEEEEEECISPVLPCEVLNENEDAAEEELKSPFSNILNLEVKKNLEVQVLKDDFLPVINKVRRICKIFIKSPKINARLQDLVKAQFNGKEIKLTLDCQTKWNSLISMIERFLKLKHCISKALQLINSIEVITSKEWEILEEISDVLHPFEIALKGLCSRDATLLTAEVSFKFIIKKLSEKNTPLSRSLKESIVKYYSLRRQPEIVGLLKYLHDPRTLKIQSQEDELSCLFSPPPIFILKRTADILLKRLFNKNGVLLDQHKKESVSKQEPCCAEGVDMEIGKDTNDDYLLIEFLQDMEELQAVPPAISDLNIEFRSFEVTFKRTENLERLYKALHSIKPTSVESERAFSAGGLYLTKMRSNLSENSLNNLCFLKTVLQNEK